MLERLLAGLVVLPFVVGTTAVSDEERVDSEVAFTFRDDRIVESSGLAVVDGLVATVNDSGGSGQVFAVDPATGETVGTSGWGGQTDIEALAPGLGPFVWVGDIGDNLERRDSIEVPRAPVGRRDVLVDPVSYDLVYPDGPHDAETLLSDPGTGRLYVATKSPLGGTLFAAPTELDPAGPNRLEPLGDVLPLATDGAFLADGRRLVVRNYAMAAVYAFPSLERLAQFRLPPQEQGEGLAVDADGSLLLSSEGVRQDVLRVSVPAPEPTVTPTPSVTVTPQPPQTESREDRELPETTETERAAWPWLFGGLVGAGVLVVLGLSLRRR